METSVIVRLISFLTATLVVGAAFSSPIPDSLIARPDPRLIGFTRLTAERQALVRELPDLEHTYVASRDNGTVRLLVAEGAQGLLGVGAASDEPEAIEGAATVWVDRFRRAFGFESSSSDDRLVITVQPGTAPGEQLATAQQWIGGYPVAGASLSLLFLDGQAYVATGDLMDTRGVRRPAQVQTTERLLMELQQARSLPALPLASDLSYSREFQKLVLRASDNAHQVPTTSAYVLDAETGQLLKEYDEAVPNGPVSETADRLTWTGLYEVGATLTFNSQPVASYCYDTFPYVGTITLESPGATDRPYVMYKEPVWSPQSVVQDADVSCVVANWTDFSDYSLDWYAVSTKSVIDELSLFANDASAMFGWSRSKEGIIGKLHEHRNGLCTTSANCLAGHNCVADPPVQNPNCGGANTCYCTPPGTSSYLEGSNTLRIDNSAGTALTRQDARYLSTMIHEYGHYLHDMYGYKGQEGVGVLGLHEGWANAMTLWYALWKKATGPWSGLAYTNNLIGGHRVQQVEYLGEFILGQYPVPYQTPYDEFLYHPNSFCSNPAPDNYLCGNPMSTVLWELGHNKCRLSYMNCTPGVNILSGVSWYQQNPEEAVFDAYSYAIKNINPTDGIAAFMQVVEGRYLTLKNAGLISQNDLDRVRATLASHCLGTQGMCNSLHRNPDQPLPSSRTVKATHFFEGELYGSSSGSFSTPTWSNGASNNKYLTLNNTGETCYTYTAPSSGAYRVNIYAWVSATSNNTISVYSAAAGWSTHDLTPQGAKWARYEVTKTMNSGAQSVCLRQNSTDTFYADAIVIKPL